MLTIVIPTRNRSEFLIRSLYYYAQRGCPYPFLIGDSSEEDHWHRTSQALHCLAGQLRIVHQRFPSYQGYPFGMGLIECMNDLLKQVETKYTLFVADDDFVIPGALEEAVRFLQERPGYSGVIGEAGFFTVSGRAHGEILEVWRYPQFTLDGSTARERLLTYFRNSIATEHAVKPTDQMRAEWRARSALEMDTRFGELLVCSLGAIQGKVHKLKRLFLFRQNHETMVSREVPTIIELDYLTSPDFVRRYERFRDCLAQALSKADVIPLEEAREIVKEGFWWHLASGLLAKWNTFYGQKKGVKQLGRLRESVRAVSSLRRSWRTARVLFPRRRDEMSLPALLQLTSLYHADFMPIYETVTGPQVPVEAPGELSHATG